MQLYVLSLRASSLRQLELLFGNSTGLDISSFDSIHCATCDNTDNAYYTFICLLMVGGRPSKKPRLVRSSYSLPGSAGRYSQNVHRHRIFTVQSTGQVNLRTRYIDAVLPASDVSETECDIGTNSHNMDPWNEIQYDDSEPQVHDDVLVAKEKRKRTAGVSKSPFN